ncbi:MAG TPA: cytochrome c, partial [Ramlibacter sp.]
MPSAPSWRAAALACAAACATLAAGLPAAAQNAPPEPLALRKIMRDLGHDMEAVSGAISREDWTAIAKLAPRIASHPQPPAGEKLRILSFAGSNASAFRAHDQRTHDAALALQEAAARADGKGVIAAFATLQNTCLACHQAFRPSFVEHFYG